MKHIFIVIIAILANTACCYAQKSQASYGTIRNIRYRLPGDVVDTYLDSLCRLDVYYPENKKDFATIIWFHGGSLRSGRRSVPEALKNKGYAVVAVDYRLTPHVSVIDCIDDAAAAVAWTVENIHLYGGSADKVFIAGHSAGAYLSLMLGLDKKWMARYDMDPDRIFKAILSYSSQAASHTTYRETNGWSRFNVVCDSMAPMNHIRPDCVPVLLMTGDRELELLGRYEENAYFWRMMKLSGHRNVTLYEFDGFNHRSMTKPGHLIALQYIKDILASE